MTLTRTILEQSSCHACLRKQFIPLWIPNTDWIHCGDQEIEPCFLGDVSRLDEEEYCFCCTTFVKSDEYIMNICARNICMNDRCQRMSKSSLEKDESHITNAVSYSPVRATDQKYQPLPTTFRNATVNLNSKSTGKLIVFDIPVIRTNTCSLKTRGRPV